MWSVIFNFDRHHPLTHDHMYDPEIETWFLGKLMIPAGDHRRTWFSKLVLHFSKSVISAPLLKLIFAPSGVILHLLGGSKAPLDPFLVVLMLVIDICVKTKMGNLTNSWPEEVREDNCRSSAQTIPIWRRLWIFF